jgi:hypothetical protein
MWHVLVQETAQILYWTNQEPVTLRVRQTVTRSEAFNRHRREKKKNLRKYAIGINSTNKFRNWLGLQLLYFATKIDAKNSLETRAMWHNNQGERQL